ncbi:hypothetical protein LZ32DRAFT_622474 [Colletotrichum eremochloae]|nr:hypothetical protein LZ32DRAFT_622474 [Colletotrichum eremochloae]
MKDRQKQSSFGHVVIDSEPTMAVKARVLIHWSWFYYTLRHFHIKRSCKTVDPVNIVKNESHWEGREALIVLERRQIHTIFAVFGNAWNPIGSNVLVHNNIT